MPSAFRHVLKGFTLIELLIVVAIIAILAAIAVPNFLESQTRSKVARVKSDQRSVDTALEAYRVDWNHLPPMESNSAWGRWFYGSPSIFRKLTTPVAYIASDGAFRDVFNTNLGYEFFAISIKEYWPTYCVTIKDRGIRSYGPDRNDDGGAPPPRWTVYLYDPTNGTVSNGDIWRIDGKGDVGGSYEVLP
jgi:prepilin-type N-terminal cleavage/methylation domain-containing protein